jgi:hypothetical protein
MCSTKGLSIPAPIHRHSSTHSQDKVAYTIDDV